MKAFYIALQSVLFAVFAGAVFLELVACAAAGLPWPVSAVIVVLFPAVPFLWFMLNLTPRSRATAFFIALSQGNRTKVRRLATGNAVRNTGHAPDPIMYFRSSGVSYTSSSEVRFRGRAVARSGKTKEVACTLVRRGIWWYVDSVR